MHPASSPSVSRKTVPISSRAWCDYFQQNARWLRPIPWDEEVRLPADERAAIVPSVQTFQLGETGNGSHLMAVAREHALRKGDPDFVVATRLFIAEEQRHAAFLGRWLTAAGIPRLKKDWTNTFFRRLRQMAGLELMISVLLAAEVLAKIYYAALRKSSGSLMLKRLCEQVLCDEVAHIQFQTQRLAILRSRRPAVALFVTHLAHRIIFLATAIVVWRTHRGVFRSAAMPFARYWRHVSIEIGIALRSMDPRHYAFRTASLPETRGTQPIAATAP